MKKYFHELSEDEYKELVKSKITYKQLGIDYPQPVWCNYPSATCGDAGCWGLVYFRVHNDGESYCKNCECNKLNKGEL